MATSYANLGGTGDRRRYIKITQASMYAHATIQGLVDGVTNATVTWLNGGTVDSSRWTCFDFGTDQYVIDEAKFYQSGTDSHGDWKWQGSDTGSSWTDIGSSFTLGGSTTQTITAMAGNTTAYKQYRIIGVSGTSSGSPNSYEWEFKLESAGNRTNGCAYANANGIGDRTSSITVTAGGSLTLTNPSLAVDGGYSFGGSAYISSATTSGNTIQFDLGTSRLVDEIAFWTGAPTYGTWKWQGSNDASSWTDIGSSFTLETDATGPVNHAVGRSLNGNTTNYRYIRMYCTSGVSFAGDGWIYEVEFRLDAVPSGGGERIQGFLLM